ncbi:hypothetical protein [uncultured Traorella sp.]|uniref:hypothetical protein n=1 Tax=uncultured Traorella sp. TaxID=1929048 RepID=UPI0025D93074|nr:hypothetical protein [uncultured Traorella sp.]
MRVWMPPKLKNKNHYALVMPGSFMGIMILAFLLIISTVLIFQNSEYKPLILLLVCIGITILIIRLAFMLGRYSKKNTLLFCMHQDHLYIIDASMHIRFHRGLSGYVHMAVETYRRLEEIKEGIEKYDELPKEAIEIIKVDSLREWRHHYALVCRIKDAHEKIIRRTYLMMKGYEHEDELRMLLERKRTVSRTVEIKEDHSLFYIFVSMASLFLFIILCFFSHPSVQVLSERLYFPLLGCTFIALYITLYLIVKYRRGE